MGTASLFVHYCKRSGAPSIDGVSIGDPFDRETWSIEYSAGASQAERDLEPTLIANFDEAAEQAVVNSEVTSINGNPKAAAEAILEAVHDLVFLHGPGSGDEWTVMNLKLDALAKYKAKL